MSSQPQVAPAPSETGAPVVLVPINGRRGVVAHAIVDASDEALVVPFRWHLDTDGYAIRTVDPATGLKELMARRIMGLERGDGWEVDHISRDKLDNRRSNMRVVTHAQNMQNRVRTDGNSSYRGVSRRKGTRRRPFQAYGCLDGKQAHLGFYAEEIEAARAAAAFRRRHMTHSVDEALGVLPPCRCAACRASG